MKLPDVPWTPDLAAEAIREIAADGDTEVAHCRADDVLCDILLQLGYDKAVAEFIKMAKWYA